VGETASTEDLHTMKRIVLKNLRTTAAQATAKRPCSHKN
jgi:hypothetical protein